MLGGITVQGIAPEWISDIFVIFSASSMPGMSHAAPVAGDSVWRKSVEFFQPITMRRYFENAALPSSVTRTARDFLKGTIQPSSEYRLHILTPKIPARWGRRSVQSGHCRASFKSATFDGLGMAMPRCSNHVLPRSVTVNALPADGAR